MAKGKKAKAPQGVSDLRKELFQAAIKLRGSIEPSDYKRYVLPVIFLRFLSLKYEARREELVLKVADPKSKDYYGLSYVLEDQAEYRSAGAFIIPEIARWS